MNNIDKIFDSNESIDDDINFKKAYNKALAILSFFLMIPVLSFSTPTTKRVKKTKTVKTVKTVRRSILEVEFGTFRFESPVISKKSVFLG